MPAYPSIPWSNETKIEPLHGTQIHVAEDGLVRGYNRWSAVWYSITVVHQLITAAQAATLQSYINTNIASTSIVFTDVNGDQYNCGIGTEPVIQPQVYDRWLATVNLIGVRI